MTSDNNPTQRMQKALDGGTAHLAAHEWLPPEDRIVGIFPFDDPYKFPRLMGLLAEELQERGSGAHSWAALAPVIYFNPDASTELPPIRFLHMHSVEPKQRFAIAVATAKSDVDQWPKWKTILGAALAQLSKPAPMVRWSAIVGPDPLSNTGAGGGKTLARPVRIGTLEIAAGTTMLYEQMPSFSPNQIARKSQFVSWPLEVHGETERIDRVHLSAKALSELTLLASLLSLVFDRPWIVRQQPSQINGSLTALIEDASEEAQIEGVAPVAMLLPEWAQRAWELCSSNETIRAAILTYQEAVRLMEWHPSYALVAFMSSLQTLGSLSTPGRDKKQVRTALRTVLNEREVTEIMRLYSSRSDTVHAGMLFGSEPFAGMAAYRPVNPLVQDPAVQFHMHSLTQLQRAARRLLIHHFALSNRDAHPTRRITDSD